VMVVLDELQAKGRSIAGIEKEPGGYLDYLVRTHSITHTRTHARTHPVMMKAVF